MKIKLFIAVSCPEGSFQAGDVVDLLDTTAMGLVAGGYALEIKEAVEIIPEVKPEVVVTKSKKDKSSRKERK
jgi:hypothetical protein